MPKVNLPTQAQAEPEEEDEKRRKHDRTLTRERMRRWRAKKAASAPRKQRKPQEERGAHVRNQECKRQQRSRAKKKTERRLAAAARANETHALQAARATRADILSEKLANHQKRKAQKIVRTLGTLANHRLGVHQSTIPNAGLGLFALVVYEKGAYVTEYDGLWRSTAAFPHAERSHGARVSGTDYAIDGRYISEAFRSGQQVARSAMPSQMTLLPHTLADAHTGLASMANTASGGQGFANNVQFKLEQLGTGECSERLFLVATRKINAGDEIFLCYGSKAPMRSDPSPLVSLRAAVQPTRREWTCMEARRIKEDAAPSNMTVETLLATRLTIAGEAFDKRRRARRGKQ